MDYEETRIENRDDKTNVAVKFYYRDVLNPRKSNDEGKPIFDKILYIEKIVLGDQFNRYDQPATQKDKERFYEAYERFNKNQQAIQDGMPLETWQEIKPDEWLVAKLKQSYVHTVEQLSNITDDIANRIDFHCLKYKYKAIEYLKLKGGEIAELKRQNEMLLRRLEALENKKPRGRPRNDSQINNNECM